MTIIAVIPALNEEKTIHNVISSLKTIVDKIIVVNDCSTDNTGPTSKSSGAYVINNNRNLGYSKSLDKGILAALKQDASIVITIDADGQHPVDKGKKMISLVKNYGYDVVVGTRNSFPRYSERLFSFYSKFKYNLTDLLCGMKCYSRKALVMSGVSCNWDSLGIFITIRAVQEHLRVKTIDLNISDRKGNKSRFGTSLKGEVLILKTLFKLIRGNL